VVLLEALPNIGPRLAGELRLVGITDSEDLTTVGADGAWTRLRAAGLRDCAQSLLALHGAVRGVRWHQLPPREREALRGRAEGLLVPPS